jgi:hypothetical protein
MPSLTATGCENRLAAVEGAAQDLDLLKAEIAKVEKRAAKKPKKARAKKKK